MNWSAARTAVVNVVVRALDRNHRRTTEALEVFIRLIGFAQAAAPLITPAVPGRQRLMPGIEQFSQ